MPWPFENIQKKPLGTVLMLGIALFLSGNWILPLMDRDEPKFAEASREMLQNGDWLVPRFNGQYRFDKPPLIYWCQAACYKVLGESEFAARLPSAVFTMATAVLLLLWGRRLGQEKAGFYSAVMLMTCLQCLIHGRLAVADMPMVFFVALAVWSGWEMTRPQAPDRMRWGWIFYASLGLGFLAKGPVAWLPLVGIGLGRWLRPGDFYLPFFSLLAGITMALVMIGLWGVPALLATHGQFFTVGIGHHVVFRSLGIMEGHGGAGWLGFVLTLPLYLVTFFFSFFPWCLKVPGAVRSWWSARAVDTLGWYLLVQAAIVFAVFTVVRTKLPHYTLPAFPALSLWLALRLTCRPEFDSWLVRATVGMCALGLVVTLGLFRMARPYFVASNLRQQMQLALPPNTEFAATDFDEPSLVWEFRRISTNYMEHLTAVQANEFFQKPGPRLLIVPMQQLTPELSRCGTNVLTFRAAGLDTARFRRVRLAALLKAP